MNNNDKIFVAGGSGLVGSSIINLLKEKGHNNIRSVRKKEVDLMDSHQVNAYFNKTNPEYVFMAAAKVGGIHANNAFPAEFIHHNLAIQTNVIEACKIYGVRKLMFLGSVCIYPKYAEIPVKEEALLTGELESSNQWYAVAKIAGIKLCQAYRRQYGCDFISVMPCNLYGHNDNFHPDNSHVIPGLIRKFVDAKRNNLPEVICWGTGEPRREFMYVDDMADACIFIMNNYSKEEIINIGCGIDYKIKDLAEMISKIVKYDGKIIWDTSKPDGMMKKCLDVSRMEKTGFKPKITLKEGIIKSIAEYREIKSKNIPIQ